MRIIRTAFLFLCAGGLVLVAHPNPSHAKLDPVFGDEITPGHGLADALDLTGLGSRRKVSTPDRPPLSRPNQRPMSTFPADPLAALPPVLDPAEPQAATSEAPEFILPFERGRVTSLFNQGRRHPAIDLAGKLGSPVVATTKRQRVVFTGWRGGYGRTVMTRDPQGRTHLYAHLQRITTKVGTVLDQGHKLGLLGSTGHSTGPHVHYEVRTPAGRHINPVTVLFPGRKVWKGLAWSGGRLPPLAQRSVVAGYPRPR